MPKQGTAKLVGEGSSDTLRGIHSSKPGLEARKLSNPCLSASIFKKKNRKEEQVILNVSGRKEIIKLRAYIMEQKVEEQERKISDIKS